MRFCRAISVLFGLLGFGGGCGDSSGGDIEADGSNVTYDAAPAVDGGAESDAGAADGGCEVPLTAQTVTVSGRLIVVYLKATDTAAADADVRREYMDRAVTAIQDWYGEAMAAGSEGYGDETFPFEPTRQLDSAYTRAEWSDFSDNGFPGAGSGCGMWYAADDELGTGTLLADNDLPPLYSPGVFYLVFGGAGTGGGCGAGGLAAVEEMEADRVRARCPNGRNDGCAKTCSDPGGLDGIDPWCEESIHRTAGYGCTAVGALAHEIGHGFGLPHCVERPTCTGDSLMDLWWEYDRGVYLSDEDRQDLDASEYFAIPK